MVYFCRNNHCHLKHLSALNKYLWKYRSRLLWGIVFVVLSNFFDILSPQISGYVINMVQQAIKQNQQHSHHRFNSTARVITIL